MMTQHARYPKWLSPANRVMRALSRLGIVVGPVHILSVPGRKSGQMRTTPVSPFELNDARYIVAGDDHADWVRNARAAGWARLRRGSSPEERVSLVEVPVAEREPMLLVYREKVPGSIGMFRQLHGVSGDAESFATLKDVCPVFRIEPVAMPDARAA